MATVTGQEIRECGMLSGKAFLIGKTNKGYGRTPLPSQARTMTPVEAAYVGAMIDGEGWMICGQGRNRNEIALTLGNTDLEIISALLRATGVGRVHMAKQRKPHHRLFFLWNVTRQLDVLAVAKQCAVFSTKAQRFLQEWYDGN